MGGIADYSGSLVLQWPIREATRVALQRRARSGPGHRCRTVRDGQCRRLEVPLAIVADRDAIVRPGAPLVRRRSGATLGRLYRGRLSCAGARARRDVPRRRDARHRVGRAGREGRQLVGGARGGDDGSGAGGVASGRAATACARSAVSRSRTWSSGRHAA